MLTLLKSKLQKFIHRLARKIAICTISAFALTTSVPTLVLAANKADITNSAAPVILVFGDSLSAGYGIRATESWPSLLEARLRETQHDYAVVNLSISGETTAGGRTRLKAALNRHRPQIVIIELGANDGLRGLPLGAMQDNLSAMLREVRTAGARALLVGMQLPPNYGPYATNFQAVFADLALQHKTPLVPFLLEGIAGDARWFLADGLHPTREAQVRLLDNVWPQLAPLLAKKRAQASASAAN